KLNRVLLLEMHAAKRAGMLTADDDSSRFAQFVALAMQAEFAASLDHLYPPLLPRLRRMLDQQRGAIEALVERLVVDRERLVALLGQVPGKLIGLTLGHGDSHAGGHTVARLVFEGGTVMYKPRSLRIDAVLDHFLAQVFGEEATRIRVPAVLDCGDYGWAAYAKHRYCVSDSELHTFYHSLGHWLAVLRLLGGTDIHLENLIAVGPVPMVVDIESLFARIHADASSSYGHAHDLAEGLIRRSVLRTGIVPFRASTPGLENVDFSAAGSLPGEQPRVHAPVVDGEGTTEARIKIIDVEFAAAQNHPSPHPELPRFWDDIGEGFLAATARLRQLDAEGRLVPLVEMFMGSHARDIRRPTKTYLDIARMLWHPASLHQEATALDKARDLFMRNAAVMPIAPSSAEEIAGELDDLCHGDVPVFTAPLSRARIEATLGDWRAMRIELEEMAIRTALVVTELNHRIDGPGRLDDRMLATHPHATQLEARRRKLATHTVERLLQLAVHGNDGTVTWIAPGVNHSGWHVQPLYWDLYGGLGGVAVALAGYLHEVAHGRADAVAGVEPALKGAVRVLHAMADDPRNLGGFAGLGGCIWYWLALHDLMGQSELLASAVQCGQAMERNGFESDRMLDIIDGSAGAIVPLLGLAEATNDRRWLDLAARAGKHLESCAVIDERGARWPTEAFADPIGGFAHGATGIGWALARLALADAGSKFDRQRWSALAQATFAFQESLFDTQTGNWREQPSGHSNIHTWCGGSVGIGMVATDLYSRGGDARHLRDMRRAVAKSSQQWGNSLSLCHGDFSLWELLARSAALDTGYHAIDREQISAQLISAIEESCNMGSGMTQSAFTPGLMTGMAGTIHCLARMHEDCTLASPLLLERQPHFKNALHL
ncbi:type 2 lanthipeptide synthetase LanM family protein, partial [Dyella sp.]|uniref:type 2 lanthipeptide synthetase LanM family protein n=1 Tax=Dyella sp. TaxID=1869338 RepID=UPI002ED68E61